MSIVFEMWGRSAASGKSQNHRWADHCREWYTSCIKGASRNPVVCGYGRIEQVKLPRALTEDPFASAVQPVHRLCGRRPIPPFREIVLFSKTWPVS